MFCLTLRMFLNRIKMMFCKDTVIIGQEVKEYEDDVSAQEEIKSEGSRFQKENEHCRRKKGSCSEKS